MTYPMCTANMWTVNINITYSLVTANIWNVNKDIYSMWSANKSIRYLFFGDFKYLYGMQGKYYLLYLDCKYNKYHTNIGKYGGDRF